MLPFGFPSLLLVLLIELEDPSLFVCFNRLFGEDSSIDSSNASKEDVELVHTEYMDSIDNPLNKVGGAIIGEDVCSSCSSAQSFPGDKGC